MNYNSGENYPSMDQYNYNNNQGGNMGQQGQGQQQGGQYQQTSPSGGQQQQQNNSGFGFPSPTLYNMAAAQQQSPMYNQNNNQFNNNGNNNYNNNNNMNMNNNQNNNQHFNNNAQYSPPGDTSRQFISQISDNPLTQAGLSYGLNYGSTLFSGGKQYVDSNFGKYFSFSTLKYYFNVNNSYVFNKIKLLIFPYTQKTWKRRIARNNDVDSCLPPRDDINSPDLYIPLMSFITYFLLYGFQMGMNQKFSPDILGGTITKGIVFWVVELLIFKCGFFFTNSNSIPVYDMISYSGYKYVLMVIFQIASILVGSYVSFFIKIILSISIGFFMLKTLRLVFSSVASNMHHDHISSDFNESSSKARNYFVFFFSILQSVLCFIV